MQAPMQIATVVPYCKICFFNRLNGLQRGATLKPERPERVQYCIMQGAWGRKARPNPFTSAMIVTAAGIFRSKRAEQFCKKLISYNVCIKGKMWFYELTEQTALIQD